MKKTLYFILIFAIALVSVITGCSDNILTEEGVLNISINGMGSRGIEPVSMETVRYDITVKNSSNATIYTGWADLDDDLTLSIPPGLYKVSVDAKNADGLVIGSGYAEGEVAAGSTTELLIVVNELKGDGALSIEVIAKEDQGIAYRILSGDGKNCGSGLLGYDGDVFFDEVELPNGFYILQIMDYETNKVLKSQTVRIVRDQVTVFFTKVAYIGDTPIYSRYSIGDIGPAGGYIFYDCDADNASGNADGLISTEVGWRYLEAAPTDIHIVKGVPSIDSKLPGYSSGREYMSFGYYRTSAHESDLYVNGTTTYDSSDCTGTAVGTGQKNTQMLVSVMGEDAYFYEVSIDPDYNSNKICDYAARMCDILEYEYNGVVYDDWFLPSKDELNQMYFNLYVSSLAQFDSYDYYWSSSESSYYINNAWELSFYNGDPYEFVRRASHNRVRPIRAFLTGDEVMEPHVHKFSEKWSFDGDNHWHKPICIHLDEKSEFGEHEFVDDVCVVCGFSADMSSLFEVDEDGNIYPIDKGSLPNYVIIPSQVGGIAVTGIGENAFSGCSFIDTVIIPDSVTGIGREAFSDCSGLRNISFGNSLTDIVDGAFFACSSLESIIIPHSVKTIGECLFYGCTSLDYLYVPESVEVIDQWTFYACNPAFFECESPAFVGCQFDNKAFQILGAPSELTISSLYNSIDAYAFAKTDVESITIPTSVMSIGECAFYGSEKLRSITYQGTKAQWNAIVKADDWSSGVALGCVIKCKDGTIDLNDMSYLFDITSEGYIYPKNKNNLPSEILIPHSVDGIPVVGIGEDAFSWCENLESISIPSSLRTIRWGAFRECWNLKDVYVSDLDSWLSILFEDYSSNPLMYAENLYVGGKLLEGTLEIPEGVEFISRFAFTGLTGLTELYIPNSVIHIEPEAFRDCIGLSIVHIPSSVHVDPYAFLGCNPDVFEYEPTEYFMCSFGSNVYHNYNEPCVLKISSMYGEIEPYTFYSSNLERLTIPVSISRINEYAFNDCPNLICISYMGTLDQWELIEKGENWDYGIPSGCTIIYEGEHSGPHSYSEDWSYDEVYHWHAATCGHLNEKADQYEHECGTDGICVVCGYSETMYNLFGIDQNGNIFVKDKELLPANVEIPRYIGGIAVEGIAENAFDGCEALERIIIPDSVRRIGWSAFEGCWNLNDVYIPDLSSWLSIEFGDNPLQYAENLYVGGNLMEGTIEIPEDVMSIPAAAFYGFSGLTEVIIPDSVLLIGDSAFSRCTNLNSINLGNSISVIMGGSFAGCESLESISIPDSVKTISAYAFESCSNLKSVEIGNSVTIIGNRAFAWCSNLESITIPASLRRVGSWAFDGCWNLMDVHVPDLSSWLSIEFEDNSNPMQYARNLYVGGKVLKGAFEIPEGVTSIPSYAFSGLGGITEVVIPDSVSRIGSHAFASCANLESVILGNSVTSIGEYAFAWCSNLESITIPASLRRVGSWAFDGCWNLMDVHVPDLSSWLSIEFEDNSNPMQYARNLYVGGKVLKGAFEIPEGVTSIPSYSFSGLKGPTEVIIPDSVISIGTGAFSDCSNLTTITYSGTKDQWKQVIKGSIWRSGCPLYAIDCNDGSLTLEKEVGDIGPAGGYIFYDCDADNDRGNADGLISKEVGWRYLEAAPADLRVVDGVPTVDSSLSGYSSSDDDYVFGYYRTSDSGRSLYVNGATTYNSSECTGTKIGTGKRNTQLLVSAMGTEAYSSSSGSSKTGNYAAKLCEDLSYTVDDETFDDWFLPSIDELNLMYENLYKAGLGGFADDYYYWSSSEYDDYADDALLQVDGGWSISSRYSSFRVRAVRAFLTYDICEHIWGEGVVSSEPLCERNGVITYNCIECNMTKVEIIPMTGHQLAEEHICMTCGQFIPFIGPAGGYVFYDCDADNDRGNDDGLISSEVGWRYLEAAPADLSIVDGVPTVDSMLEGYSSGTQFICFGEFRTSENGDCLYLNGTDTYVASDCTGTAIGTGQRNSQMLVCAMGNTNAYGHHYLDGWVYGETKEYAARLCDILEYENNGVVYDDWFLPSKDELNLMYENLKEEGLGGFASSGYWSSSESRSSADYAWLQYFNNGLQYSGSRDDDYRVRAVRAF